MLHLPAVLESRRVDLLCLQCEDPVSIGGHLMTTAIKYLQKLQLCSATFGCSLCAWPCQADQACNGHVAVSKVRLQSRCLN